MWGRGIGSRRTTGLQDDGPARDAGSLVVPLSSGLVVSCCVFALSLTLSNKLERREFAAQHGCAVGLEPAFQNASINRAEIHLVFDVALEEVGGREAGIFAKQPGFDFFTHDKHRG